VAERSEVIRREIEETRGRMGETIDALAYKADVPGRTKGWLGGRKDALVSRVSGVTPSGEQVKGGSMRLKDTAERNPLGLALGGVAVGFLAGVLAPSTRVENEKLGPLADQVKATAAEAGQEALERGKATAQEAASAAVGTAKEEGRRHGEELSSSVQERSHEIDASL
jgi:hypothetical protein